MQVQADGIIINYQAYCKLLVQAGTQMKHRRVDASFILLKSCMCMLHPDSNKNTTPSLNANEHKGQTSNNEMVMMIDYID